MHPTTELESLTQLFGNYTGGRPAFRRSDIG